MGWSAVACHERKKTRKSRGKNEYAAYYFPRGVTIGEGNGTEWDGNQLTFFKVRFDFRL